MISATDKDNAIAMRCAALGLSRPQAQALADAGPFPYNVSPFDLPYMLGLDSETFTRRPPKPWLWMAARSASVSYKGMLTPETLLDLLVKGEVPAEFAAHTSCFLEEVQMQTLVLALEQAAQQSGISIKDIWGNVARINETLQGRRLQVIDSFKNVVHGGK